MIDTIEFVTKDGQVLYRGPIVVHHHWDPGDKFVFMDKRYRVTDARSVSGGGKPGIVTIQLESTD